MVLLPTLRRSLVALPTATPQAYGRCRTRWNCATLAMTLQAKRGITVSTETMQGWLHDLGWIGLRCQQRFGGHKTAGGFPPTGEEKLPVSHSQHMSHPVALKLLEYGKDHRASTGSPGDGRCHHRFMLTRSQGPLPREAPPPRGAGGPYARPGDQGQQVGAR